jgi:hypothetical protein
VNPTLRHFDRALFVPLLSNGSAFTHGGLWFNTGTDYTLDQIRGVQRFPG